MIDLITIAESAFSNTWPWIKACGSIVGSLLLKDYVQQAVIGFRIYMSNQFNVGDEVYLDGERAIIIKQDFSKTIFELESDGIVTRRYVFNSKFRDLIIEKIIQAKKES